MRLNWVRYHLFFNSVKLKIKQDISHQEDKASAIRKGVCDARELWLAKAKQKTDKVVKDYRQGSHHADGDGMYKCKISAPCCSRHELGRMNLNVTLSPLYKVQITCSSGSKNLSWTSATLQITSDCSTLASNVIALLSRLRYNNCTLSICSLRFWR